MADKNSLTLAQVTALVKLAKKVDQFNNLLSGNGPPGDNGTNGDWYVDVLTKRLYGPKTETAGRGNPLQSEHQTKQALHAPLHQEQHLMLTALLLLARVPLALKDRKAIKGHKVIKVLQAQQVQQELRGQQVLLALKV